MNKDNDNMKSFQYRFDTLTLSNNLPIFENFPQSTRLDNIQKKKNINYQNYSNPRSTNQTINQDMNPNFNSNFNQNMNPNLNQNINFNINQNTKLNYKKDKTKYIENYYSLPMNSTLPIHQNKIDAITSINTRQ